MASGIVSEACVYPAESASNGGIVSSVGYGGGCHCVPPQLPVFTVPDGLSGMSNAVARLTLAVAKDSYVAACKSYDLAYSGYLQTVEASYAVPVSTASACSSGLPAGTYSEQFADFSSARSKGWREGTSFGAFQYSSRGSHTSVVSSNATQFPDGKCYLRIIAGGHKRSAQAMFGVWPSVGVLLRAPAVKFDVPAMNGLSFSVRDGMRLHVVSYEGCSIMASFAGYISRNAGRLNVNSSVWDGSLLHAIMSRGDYVDLLAASSKYRFTPDAVVGGESAVADTATAVSVESGVSVPSEVATIARSATTLDVPLGAVELPVARAVVSFTGLTSKVVDEGARRVVFFVDSSHRIHGFLPCRSSMSASRFAAVLASLTDHASRTASVFTFVGRDVRLVVNASKLRVWNPIPVVRASFNPDVAIARSTFSQFCDMG